MGHEDVQGRSDERASRPRGALGLTEAFRGRYSTGTEEGREQARKLPNPNTGRVATRHTVSGVSVGCAAMHRLPSHDVCFIPERHNIWFRSRIPIPEGSYR